MMDRNRSDHTTAVYWDAAERSCGLSLCACRVQCGVLCACGLDPPVMRAVAVHLLGCVPGASSRAPRNGPPAHSKEETPSK